MVLWAYYINLYGIKCVQEQPDPDVHVNLNEQIRAKVDIWRFDQSGSELQGRRSSFSFLSLIVDKFLF